MEKLALDRKMQGRKFEDDRALNWAVVPKQQQ
jgi:hypothetical protein